MLSICITLTHLNNRPKQNQTNRAKNYVKHLSCSCRIPNSKLNFKQSFLCLDTYSGFNIKKHIQEITKNNVCQQVEKELGIKKDFYAFECKTWNPFTERDNPKTRSQSSL